ncbi:MAG: hypothetical protein Q9217_003857 [Psora testacea]
MEISHSKPWAEIVLLLDIMDHKMAEITDYTFNHRARLVKPLVSYDNAAIALSFLPAAGELLPGGRKPEGDEYTYQHLRRDLYDICQSTGVEVASRYVVPSSHLTIARFVDQDIFQRDKMGQLIEEIEKINAKLQEKYWPHENDNPQGQNGEPLQWIVGEEKGLVCRKGTVWYGGGESHYEGKGFSAS